MDADYSNVPAPRAVGFDSEGYRVAVGQFFCSIGNAKDGRQVVPSESCKKLREDSCSNPIYRSCSFDTDDSISGIFQSCF